MARQQQARLGALAGRRFDAHGAARLAREAVHHRQAQARALPHRFGGEEGIEGVRQHVRRHAGAAVAHAHQHVLAGLARGDGGVAGLDVDRSALEHGVARVVGQIEQRASQLVGIAQRGPQAHRQARAHGDGRAERGVDARRQVLGLAHAQAQLHQLEVAGDAGQRSIGPSFVAAQSWPAMRAAISPPPVRKVRLDGSLLVVAPVRIALLVIMVARVTVVRRHAGVPIRSTVVQSRPF
nr:hypothetical protein [Massilia sp. 9096]